MMLATAEVEEIESGTIVDDRYIVRQKIGRGNMATVYLATDELANREVAIKIMSARLVGRPDRVRRFFNEHRFTTIVGRHDNIVFTYGDGRLGGEDGTPYLVMERVIGPSLELMIALDRRLEAPRAARVILGVAKALQVVHAVGIVHRDIKPGNILIAVPETGDGEVPKLADFGLAVHVRDDGNGALRPRMTLHDQLPGSSGYMAPELVDRVQPHASADVFGLGMVLAEALVGRNPYYGIAREDYLAEVTRPDWSLAERVLTQIESEPLRSLVVDCTRRDPRDRPSVADVIARLEPIAASSSVDSMPRLSPDLEVCRTPTVAAMASEVLVATDRPSPGESAPSADGDTTAGRPAARSRSPHRWRWIGAVILLVGIGLALALVTPDAQKHAAPATRVEPSLDQSAAAALAVSTTDDGGSTTGVLETGETDPEGSSTTDEVAVTSDDESGSTGGLASSVPDQHTGGPRKRRRGTGKDDRGGSGDDDVEKSDPPPTRVEPEPVECATVRSSIEQARRDGRWSRLPYNIKAKRACFEATEYRRLLVEALARSGRHAECIEAAGSSSDPKIQPWVEQCKGNQP